MPVQDRVPITTLERAVSADFNTEGDLNNRSIVEVLRAFSRRKIQGGLVAATTLDLCSGFFLTQAAGVPWITKGLLAQANFVVDIPNDVPAVGTFDDPDYRFGVQLADAILADPWDATSAWWLLEARVIRPTTLSEVRDIYDPATQTFAPGAAIDKRYESQIETAWKKGTATNIAAPDAGWTPIAGLYRPIGGGAIATNDVVQLSCQFDDLVPVDSATKTGHRIDKRFFVNNGGLGTIDDEAKFSLAGIVAGKRLYIKDSLGTQLRTAVFIDPSDAALLAVSGYWWYLYLCAPGGCVPSNLYTSTVDHRGMLIASRVRPNDHGTNSAAIDVPAPLNTIAAQVGTGDAVHVGMFRASGVGADMEYIDVTSGGHGRINPILLLGANLTGANQYGQTLSPYNVATAGVGGSEELPYGCHWRGYTVPVAFDAAEVTAYSVRQSVRFSTDTTGLVFRYNLRGHEMGRFELTPREFDLTLIVASQADNIQLAASAGGWADVGGDSHAMGVDGIDF